MKKISVIIPVYNNQQTLIKIYQRLVKLFARIRQNYQIIFIDDGSKDHSYKKIQKICLLNGVLLMQFVPNANMFS